MKNYARSFWEGFKYYITGLYHRAEEHHIFLMSGGLAFSLFVCAVPFAVVVMAILGNMFESSDLASKVTEFVNQIIPYPQQAQQINDFLITRFDQLSSFTHVVGVIGFITLLLTATSLFSSMRTILNAAFRFKKSESIVIGKLWDFGLVIAILIVMVILMLALPVMEAGLELTSNVQLLQSVSASSVSKIFIFLTSFGSLTLIFTAIYWLVPVYKPNIKAVLVAAVSAALLWLLAKELFGYYIGHVATLKHLYGIYSFIVIAAFWIYYSAFIMIIGAEIGQLFWERIKIKSMGQQSVYR